LFHLMVAEVRRVESKKEEKVSTAKKRLFRERMKKKREVAAGAIDTEKRREVTPILAATGPLLAGRGRAVEGYLCLTPD